MEHQNQILQTLRGPESQARLERIVAQEALNNRAAVGRRVCAEFGFVDARGSAQLAGCLKALNTLHKAGRIALPASGACWSCPERIMWVQGSASPCERPATPRCGRRSGRTNDRQDLTVEDPSTTESKPPRTRGDGPGRPGRLGASGRRDRARGRPGGARAGGQPLHGTEVCPGYPSLSAAEAVEAL